MRALSKKGFLSPQYVEKKKNHHNLRLNILRKPLREWNVQSSKFKENVTVLEKPPEIVELVSDAKDWVPDDEEVILSFDLSYLLYHVNIYRSALVLFCHANNF